MLFIKSCLTYLNYLNRSYLLLSMIDLSGYERHFCSVAEIATHRD